MHKHQTPIDISSNPDLIRLVEEVEATKKPRTLTRDNKIVAVLVPVTKADSEDEDIFDTLSQNKAFLTEAEEAKKQLANTPTRFTNLTEKYSHLIEQSK